MATKRITKKQAAETARMAEIVERLKDIYPDVVCALEWGGQYGGERDFLLRESWKLLVMGRLSAQCTDARVNIVCKDLFEKFPTVQAMAEGEITEIEAIVRPCGLYHTKAQNIKDFSAIICEQFDGKVPDTMEELLTLPGVGRKTANVVGSNISYLRNALRGVRHKGRIVSLSSIRYGGKIRSICFYQQSVERNVFYAFTKKKSISCSISAKVLCNR